MASFNTLYDLVLPYLPGAEPALVDSHIRKIARDFLKRSTILREQFVFETVAGVPTYELQPTAGQVSAVVAVWLPDYNHTLRVATEDRRHPEAPGQPRAWWTMVPSVLSLWPTPDSEYRVSVNAVVTTTLDTPNLPDVLVEHHAEALAAGVLSMMMAMPGKPWTQRNAAEASGRQYAGAVRTARATVREGGQPNHSTFTAARKFGR